ncbi:MAG: aminotransferase class III-fold pyridoxal phosphate-dependent enzyme [Pseudomonadota bacterium]
MKDMNFLKENNARFMWHPMAHPSEMQANPPEIIVRGEGVRVWDVDGHGVLDAVGGLWNVNLGYSCDPVKAAITSQLDTLPFYSAFRGTTNDAAIELSWMLQEFFAEEAMTRCFFTSGGSDSVEIALRLARQFHKVRGASGRTKYISFKKGYHGTHTMAASVNGNANFRTQYEPLMPGCFHIPAPYLYRNPFGAEDAETLTGFILAALEDEIAFQGAETIAAFIMEPVLGAGGVLPPHPTLMPGIREICDRHGILLIADEVITGFGRTGDWSGSRHWGVKPDLMCTAKAITNGYFPFGAVMISDHVADTFEADDSGRGTVFSGYTYSGHPVGAAAAIACLTETKRLNVKDNAAARGQEIFAGLCALKEKHELVGDVRGGHGLMSALEIVADRETKQPADKATMAAVFHGTYEAGAMVRVSGNNVMMSPPLILTSEDVQTILTALDEGLSAAASHAA